MTALRRLPAPLLATVSIALAASGLVACGDSDDGGGGGGDGGGTGKSLGADEQQVKATVDGLYADLADYDAAAVCARMSPAAQKQIAQGAVGTAATRDSTCAESFGKFLDLAKKSGGLKRTLSAKVGKIQVDGDEATATVSFGAQQGKIPLRKVDGEWKVGIALATPSAAPPAEPLEDGAKKGG